MKKLFKKYDPVFEIENNMLKGNITRLETKINLELGFNENYNGELNDIFFTEKVHVNFKSFSESLNSLFDNYNDFANLNYIKKNTNNFKIRVYSKKFKFNNLVKEMGDNIIGNNFSLTKKENGYNLIYNGKIEQESIKNIKTFLLIAIDLGKEK